MSLYITSIPRKSITLEQFVQIISPEEPVRISAQLVQTDHNLAAVDYAKHDEYPAFMPQDEQFLYALFILEAEER